MGAVTYSITCLISLLIGPIQRHSFKLRAIKRLYLARSEGKDIFGYDFKKDQLGLIYRSNETYDQKVNQQLCDEIKKHETIRFQFGAWVSLLLGCSKDKAHKKIVREGQRRVD